jgi:hypothetical protein
MIPLYKNQLMQDVSERLLDLNIIQTISRAEAQRIGKCFKLGLILVSYDRPYAPAYCVAKSECQFGTILQALKHLA